MSMKKIIYSESQFFPIFANFRRKIGVFITKQIFAKTSSTLSKKQKTPIFSPNILAKIFKKA
jgi:hypothetical protein